MKNKKIIAIIIAALVVIALVIIKNKGPVAVGGCCTTGDQCASGPTVTEQFCTDELGGTYSAGKQCNNDTAVCE